MKKSYFKTPTHNSWRAMNQKPVDDKLDKILDEFTQQSFGAVWNGKEAKVEFVHTKAKQAIKALYLAKLPNKKIVEPPVGEVWRIRGEDVGWDKAIQAMQEAIEADPKLK